MKIRQHPPRRMFSSEQRLLRRWSIATLAASLLLLNPVCMVAQAATALNLSSTVHNVSAPAAAIINVGGSHVSVHPGQLLTPAELVAVDQILQSGQQQLIIGTSGNATGGILNINNSGGAISSITIPHGVTALDNFATSSLVLTGDYTNAGRFYAFSTSPSASTASLQALDIINERGGVISSTLPSGSFGLQNTIPALNLDLIASNNVINHGTIISSGDLSITGGNSIVNTGSAGAPALLQAAGNMNLFTNNLTNSGTISSQSANVNISSQNANDLIFNNTSGTVQALGQSININSALYNQQANLTITGGNLLSKDLNILSGNGNVVIDSNNVTGLLSTQAASVFMQASTPNLQIGNIEVSGDPTFFNTTGSIIIDSPLTENGNSLAIVAKGNILSGTTGAISTNSATEAAGSITLIAGANFTTNGGTSVTDTSGSGDTTHTLKIMGGAPAGGLIDLTGGNFGTAAISSLTAASTSGAGGDITLVAFAGTGSSSGKIILPSNVVVNSTGSSGSSNGNVLMIAGATSGTALTVGGIDANGGAGTTGGNISLFAAKPVLTNTTITDGVLSGSVTAGSLTAGGVAFVEPATTPVAVADGGTFTASTAGTFDSTKASITSTGNVAINSTGSTVTLGAITTGGAVSATSAGVLTVSQPISAVNNVTLATTAKNSNIIVDANVTSSGGLVSASANGTGSIEMLNQVTKTISLPLGSESFPVGAAPTPDGEFVFIPDYEDNKVYILTTANGGTVLGNLAAGTYDNPQATAMAPGGGLLYVGNYSNGGVNVVSYVETTKTSISTALTTSFTLPTDGSGHQLLPEAMAVSPDGKTLYVVSDEGAGFTTPGNEFFTVVNVSNPASPVVVKTIQLGTNLEQTGGVVLNPQGTTAWVTNSGSKSVSVINLTTDTVVHTIDLSGFGVNNPISLAIDPNGTRIYVTEGNFNRTTEIITGAVAIINALPTSPTYDQVIGSANFNQGTGGVGTFPQGITTNATGVEVFTQTTYGSSQLPNTIALYGNSSPQLTIGITTGTGTDGIGSSTWSTVVNNNGVNNLTTYTSNTLNFESSPATVSVIQEPTMQGKGVSLTAGGLILGSYDALGGTLTANATGKNSQIILSNVGSINSTVGNSKSTGLFEIGSLAALTIGGKIASPNVILQGTTAGSDITIGSPGTVAAQVGQSGATVLISSNGTIVQGNATSSVVGANITLNTASGNIGATGIGSGASINTVTPSIAVNTAGQAFVNNTGAVTVTSSIAGGFNLTNSGTITYPANGLINATNIVLATITGSIVLNAPLGLGLTPGNTVTLMAGGTGTITEASGSWVVSADTLTLGTSGGAIGSATSPFRIGANTLDVGPGSSGSASSAFLLSATAVTLGNASVSNTLNLTAQGNITLAAPASSAQSITLQALGNAGIIIDGTTTLGSTNAKSTVTLIASGTGQISESGSVPITATLVSLQSSSGDIGAAGAGPDTSVLIDSQNLQTATQGSTYVNAANASAAQGYNLGLNSSVSGGSYNLTVSGNVAINGPIASPAVSIATQANVNGGTSQIVIGGNLGQAGPGNTVTLTTDGAPGKDDSIIFKAGTILSPQANLSVTNGSIGTSKAPIQLAVQQLSANAPAGNVFVSNAIALDFSAASGAGPTGTFSLTSGSSITVDRVISAGTVSLTANGAGGLFTGGPGSVVANNVSLIAGAGGIGTFQSPFAASGGASSGTVSVTTTGNAFLNLTGLAPQNLGKSTVGTNGLLSVSTTATLLTVTGPIAAGSIQMSLNGGLTDNGALNAKVVNISDADGGVIINGSVGQAKGIVSIGITDSSTLEGGALGSVSGASVSLTTAGGNIGDTTALSVSSTGLTVATAGTGSATLTDTSPVTLTSVSTGGSFTISGTGALTTAGAVNADGMTLKSGANISIGSALTSGGSISITSTGSSGQILFQTGAPSLSATTSISLTAVNGNIGSAALPVLTSTTTLKLATAGQAFVNNNGSVTLAQTFSGSALNLTADGTIDINAIVNSKSIVVNATGGAASDIIVGAAIGQPGASVSLIATGAISQPTATGENIAGSSLVMKTQAGDIGASGAQIVTDATTLSVSGLGTNVFVTDTTQGTLTLLSASPSANYASYDVTTGGNLNVNAPITGLAATLIAAGNITCNASISANATTVTAGNGTHGIHNTPNNGNVLVSPGFVVGTGNVGGTTDTITAGGTGTIMATDSSGFISDAITFNSAKGNIGSTGIPLLFITLGLTVHSTSGSALLLDVGAGDPLNTLTATVGGALTLTTEGSSLTLNALTVGSASTTGNNLTIVQRGGTSSGTGALSVSGAVAVTNGNVSIVQQGAGGFDSSSTGTITATSGSVSVQQLGSGGTTVGGAISGVSVSIVQVGSAGFSSTSTGTINATNGNVSVLQEGTGGFTSGGAIGAATGSVSLLQEGTSAMNINANVTSTGGNIVMQDTNTTSGTINLGVSAPIVISTLVLATAPATLGNITIVIGKLPVTAQNGGQSNFPTNATVTPSGGGNAFAGATPAAISAPGPSNAALNAKGRNIIFNSPSALDTITLGSGLTITADPPVPTSPVAVQLPHVSLPSRDSLPFVDGQLNPATFQTGAVSPAPIGTQTNSPAPGAPLFRFNTADSYAPAAPMSRDALVVITPASAGAGAGGPAGGNSGVEADGLVVDSEADAL